MEEHDVVDDIGARAGSLLRCCPSLSQDDLVALESIVVPWSASRGRSLAQLLGLWLRHVDRFEADAELDPSEWNRPNVLTAYDYVAALVLRDALESGLGLSADTAARVPGLVCLATIDARFRQMTRDDNPGLGLLGSLVAPLANASIGDGWWWSRVPAGGPVLAELLEVKDAESTRSHSRDVGN